MKKQILLDCDGVLADFVTASLELHGKTFEDANVDKWDYFHDWGVTDREFFEPMGYDFWANIEPFPWAQDLLNVLSKHEVTICTAPILNPECFAAKAEWINKHFDIPFQNIMIGKKKWLMAGNGILVDDSEKNIEKFRAAGGRAYLFPQPYNEAGKRGETPEYFIEYIGRILNGYAND